MANKGATNSAIILETSLQSFFYQKLQEINHKYTQPIPDEAVFYSSLVMDQFGESKKYFEMQEGKVREKILGIKLLESSHLPKSHQKIVLRDVGDTALLICGYFSESVNKKLVDLRYYQDLGKTAYQRLNSMSPLVYDTKDLFALISKYFYELTELIAFYSKSNEHFDPDQAFIIVNNSQLKVS